MPILGKCLGQINADDYFKVQFFRCTQKRPCPISSRRHKQQYSLLCVFTCRVQSYVSSFCATSTAKPLDFRTAASPNKRSSPRTVQSNSGPSQWHVNVPCHWRCC